METFLGNGMEDEKLEKSGKTEKPFDCERVRSVRSVETIGEHRSSLGSLIRMSGFDATTLKA